MNYKIVDMTIKQNASSGPLLRELLTPDEHLIQLGVV